MAALAPCTELSQSVILRGALRAHLGMTDRRAASIGVRRQDFHDSDGALPALRHGVVAVTRRHHVAHDAAAAGDLPALQLLSLGIEAHERIWPRVRLDVPDDVVDHRHAVGLRHWPAGALPLLDRAGLRIEARELAVRPVA